MAACRFPLKFFPFKYFFISNEKCAQDWLTVSLNHTQMEVVPMESFSVFLNVLSTRFFVTLKGNVLEKFSSVSSV